MSFKYDLDKATMKQHAKYLGQRSFSSKAIVQTNTHAVPIALPGPHNISSH